MCTYHGYGIIEGKQACSDLLRTVSSVLAIFSERWGHTIMGVGSQQGERENMAQPMHDEVTYRYYDAHSTEEDLMGGESPSHSRVILYLMEVLLWLFQDRVCAIYNNLNYYMTPEEHEHPLVPDIAIVKGISTVSTPSYYMEDYGVPPQVAFEFASEETWRRDLLEKPKLFAEMGVDEYFAYDPNTPPLPRSRRLGRRLFGWRLDRVTRRMRELQPDEKGRLWSLHLESYLEPDGKLLRLYDHAGQRRLTEAEAQKQRAEAEEQRATEALYRMDALARKLRELGIDPDSIV